MVVMGVVLVMTCEFTYEHWFETLKQYKGDLILRHDVDLDLNKALELAEEENDHGYRSIYFVLLDDDKYNVFSLESRIIVEQILEMGHQIGIHYTSRTTEALMFEFKRIFNIKNPKLTCHNPASGGTYWYNEYRPEGYKYISDSGMNWREGCICQHLDEPKLYVNTHPVWWNDEPMSRKDCLNEINIIKHINMTNTLDMMLEHIENDYLKRI